LDIVEAKGELVRHLSSSTKTNKEIQPPEWPDQIVASDLIPAKAGMNRLVWDLRYDDPVQIPGAFYEGEAPRGPIVADPRPTSRFRACSMSNSPLSQARSKMGTRLPRPSNVRSMLRCTRSCSRNWRSGGVLQK
jgi:hypothetical protein